MTSGDKTNETEIVIAESTGRFTWLMRLIGRGPGKKPEPDNRIDPTPMYISHRVRMLFVIALMLMLAYILNKLPTITSIVLLGSSLALILSFPVRVLERYISRRWSILIVTVSTFGGSILLIALAIPFLMSEITQFAESLPDTTSAIMDRAREWLDRMYARGWIDQNPDQLLEDTQTSLLDSAETIISSLLNNVVTALGATVNVVITTFGVLFVAIYMLVDIPKFKNSYIRMWAPQYRVDAVVLWDTLGFSLSRYLSAQVVSMALQGLLIFIGLTLLGVPYAFVLALVQAVTAILPYIGAWLAFIPAFMVALTIDWQTALGVAILYVAMNQIEGNLITPNLQGNAVKVHPILVFIGVIGGSQMFGIMGAILAVPAIAILRVLFEFFWLRLQVREDIPTIFAIMRNDTAHERLDQKSAGAEEGEEEAEDNLDDIYEAINEA